MSQYEDVIETKHKNQKEILSIKEDMMGKNHLFKIDYLKYLYNLKNKFLDKEEKSKVKRLKMIYAKRSKK